LLVFIRDADVCTVAARALEAIRNHRSHKRAGKI